MASHRAELGALRAARERIEAVLARDGNSAAALGIATGALDSIARMEGLIAAGRIGSADMAALANVLTVAQSTATALEAASSATSDRAAEQLAAASDEARTTARSVMTGMHDFDGQLRFASTDDRDAYRDREADRRAYIVQQPNTPAGNLNASGAAIGQMADAHAHGAGGPEFDKRWNELVAKTEKLRDAAKANGVSAEEFDHRMREDLRTILKSKGLSDAQIDARFAANPDPLDAIKSYAQGDADLESVQKAAQKAKATTAPIEETDAPVTDGHTIDPIAKLKAAGLMAVTDHAVGENFSHGLAAPVQSSHRTSGRG